MNGRLGRVNQLVKEEVSKIIQGELRDPSIRFVTVTKVDIKSGLRLAYIYITTMESEERKDKTVEALNNASGYIKRLLSGRIKLRYMPELKFFKDESITKLIKLQELFDKIGSKTKEAKNGRKKN